LQGRLVLILGLKIGGRRIACMSERVGDTRVLVGIGIRGRSRDVQRDMILTMDGGYKARQTLAEG
jgi:hypothetical protein